MGTVWVAEHSNLKADVVVKLLSDELADDPTSRARVAREASAAAQVRSPHVVQTLDHGVTEDGAPFIVLELLEGRDLSRELKERPNLEVVEAAHMLEHICRALSKAHEMGVVHRDIKPSNIFLCDVGAPEPFVKLLDFGIAKRVTEATSLTAEGSAVGTLSYMSPEQVAGEAVTHRADLWAVGIVVFRILSGRAPFRRETQSESIAAILGAELPSILPLRPGLPPALDGWFRKACAKSPSERFQSAREMADAFWESVGLVSSPYASLPPPVPAPHLPISDSPTATMTEGTGDTFQTAISDSEAEAPPQSRRAVAFGVGAGIGVAAVIAVIVGLWGGSSDPGAPAAASAGQPPAAESAPPTVSAERTRATSPEPDPEQADASVEPDAAPTRAVEPAPETEKKPRPPVVQPRRDPDEDDLGF